MKTRFVFVLLVAATSLLPAVSGAETQELLPGSAIPQFAQALPRLSVAGGTLQTVFGNAPLELRMCEFDARVLPPGTFAPGEQPTTRVWGYIAGACPATPRDTYIGPVIVNTRGTPTPITWTNDLGSTANSGLLAYKKSVDQTLHWADPFGLDCNMNEGIPEPGSPCAQNYAGPIPAVAHLHGGEVPPELDGGPDAWFTGVGGLKGHAYYTFPAAADNQATYRYPNTQEAAPLWFHDHTLGATRLNVFAGLAGSYLLVDPNLQLPANLPGPAEIIPIVLQDRMFDTNGQLLFPAGRAGDAPNPEHPYWVPEFVGDTIVVNGKAWPYLEIQAKRYRFLFLNGSNARTYEMFLSNPARQGNGPAMFVIGTDGGYLDAPVKIDPRLGQKLVMMPGERYEVIVDFAGFRGTNLILRNTGRTPYPKGTPPQGSTLGRLLQFRVGAGPVSDSSYDPASGAPLRSGDQRIVRLADPASGALAPGVAADETRQLTLNEIIGPKSEEFDPETGELVEFSGGPLEVLVNNTSWPGISARPYGDFTPVTVGGNTTYYSELPVEGDTELWEIVNLTADAHPIHLHLVQFQIVNRQRFNKTTYGAAYAAAFPSGDFEPEFGPPFDYRAANNPLSGGKVGGNPNVDPYLQGPAEPPLPNEAGWKDTVIVPPGMVTRIAVRWAPTDLPTTAPAADLHYPFDPADGLKHGYVWHCHIIDHEDNEMMRPDAVQLNPFAAPPDSRLLKKGIDY
jgi:FtsP/CotA-like multicopper oxidase with cupredoxin domain